MITNDDKMYLIDLKIDFWEQRLQESNSSIPVLNDLGHQAKIESNLLDIDNYARIIEALNKEKNTLTNQG